MICPVCKREQKDVEKRRMNTRYVDKESNFLISCLECYDHSEEYWKERWDDYYSSCM